MCCQNVNKSKPEGIARTPRQFQESTKLRMTLATVCRIVDSTFVYVQCDITCSDIAATP